MDSHYKNEAGFYNGNHFTGKKTSIQVPIELKMGIFFMFVQKL